MTAPNTTVRHAVVASFERHLTAPNRQDSTRVDLWFSLARGNLGSTWDGEFASTAEQECILLGNALSKLELFALSPERGWIVARGVDVNRLPATRIEQAIQEVVQRVNAAAAATVLQREGKPESRKPWKVYLERVVDISIPERLRWADSLRRSLQRLPEHAAARSSRPARPLASVTSGEYNQDSGADRLGAGEVA